MTARGRLWLWIVAALVALFSLIAILVWQHGVTEEFWSTFLVGDPHEGYHTFHEKGCGQCHAVNGVGTGLAPDLGFQRPARSTLNQLVTEMWNHAPRMWEQMDVAQLRYPHFSAKEMTHLFAYLYTARYMDEPGDAARGWVLFSQKGCIRCHSIGRESGRLGPDLKDVGPVDTPLFWAQAMWNHAPAMETSIRQMEMAWPQFNGDEMRDLLAYVREERAGPRREFDLLPADPERGWALFRSKSCIACHAIAGEGGIAAPDLGPGRLLPPTLTQVAALMWNHSPEMWTEMEAENIERPTFEGQEMADLIAFLYSVRYFDLPGSPSVGRELFREGQCSHCHGDDGRGGELGPALRGRGIPLTPVTMAKALWSHGPRMYQQARELDMDWPTLKERDLGNLLAFLNSPPGELR